MTKQVVNTDRIASSATKLRTVDDTINSEFRTMQDKAKLLDDNWNSAAGEAARTALHRLFVINDGRSIILQNYIRMLEKQVNPGYVGAEDANTTLADQFK